MLIPDSIIEPRAAIYLQMPHQSAGFVNGVSWGDIALQANPCKRNYGLLREWVM